jgi:flagella basal body P-ring formation protein FlgA
MKRWPLMLSLISFMGVLCDSVSAQASAQGYISPDKAPLKVSSLKELLQAQKQQQTTALGVNNNTPPLRKAGSLAVVTLLTSSTPDKAASPATLKAADSTLDTDPRKPIEQAIEQELQTTYGDMIAIKVPLWTLPQGHYSQYLVEEIQVAADQSRFTAVVSFYGASQAKTVQVRGTIEQMVNVPALQHPIHFGETIKAQDLTSIKIPSKRIGRYVIREANDLIGTTPRRGFLKVNTPITTQEIIKPQEISKGDIVTMRYYTDKMKLIAKGRALEGGSRGEIIRVLNINSDKIIQGQIVGLKEVSLRPEL